MKSIKKYFKVILCFMAFAFASLLFTFAPNVRSYAALQQAKTNYNMAIKAVKMPRSTFVDEGGNQSLRVPLLKANSTWQETAKYTIRVIDPSFTSHDYKVGVTSGEETSEADASYFTKIDVDGDEFLSISALNNGKYDILYIMEEGSELLYSNTYSVTVENVSYELDFAAQEGENKGLKTLLPETVKYSTNSADRIELPTAGVKNKETGAYVSSTGVALKVFDAYGAELDSTSSEIFKKDAETNKYYLYPNKEGKYTIEYTYAFGNNPPKKTFTIEVEKDFTVPTSSDLTINIPTMPNVELGQKEIKLPDVVVNNKTKDNIEHNVKSIVISKGSISKTLTNNTFTFDMTKEFFGLSSYTTDMLGDWYVEYTVEDAYGNTKTIKVTIDGVKDNTNPEVFMAYDYEVDADTKLPVDEDKIDTTVATEFKSQLGYNELYFPAIYAKDSVTSYKDFIFVRYIQSSRTNTIYYLDNIMLKDKEAYNISADEAYSTQKNASNDANIGKFNKAVKFEFNTETPADMAGEYTLGYQVYAKDITKQTGYLYVSNTTMYTFEILTTDLRNPTSTVEHNVEINNIKDGYSVASDGKFTVNINANETKRGESTANVDKRLKTAVFYYYNTTATATTLAADVQAAFDAAKAELAASGSHFGTQHLINTDAFVNYMKARYNGFKYAEQKNKNNYDVELTDYVSSYDKEAHIVAISIDDDNNIALATRKLNLKDMTDTEAPSASVVDAHDFDEENLTNLVVKQGTTVRLPDVSFSDNDKSLSMSVAYYVDSPVNDITGLDYQSPTGKNFKNNISGLSYIYGGSIKADKVGKYHVVYTATDDAGNTTYMYFTFEATLASDPILKVSATGDDIKSSSASTITGETGMRVDFDAVLWSNDLSQNLTETATIDYTVEDGGKNWQAAGDVTSFIFYDQGDYTITFTASYESAGVTYTAEPQTFTITVTRPELKWNETIDTSDYAYAPLGSVVTLPDLTASQGDTKAKVELKVTFKGDTQPVTKAIVNGSTVWQFTTNETLTGDYKVEYTATTAYSTITKSFTIKVGDNVPPVITIDHEDDLAKEVVYDGKTAIEYTIKLVKTSTSTNGGRKLEITITNGKDVKTYNTNLVLQDKDKNGDLKDINWDTLTAELYNGDSVMSTSSTGTYTKTYSISSTGEYKLVIKATDSNSNTATKEIKFTVKTESDVEKSNDTVVGVVLIVLSLVVLAGVILFFAFTGKGKGGKVKANKQIKSKSTKAENKEEVKEEAEEVEAPATTEEAETEAKSGDVE